MSFESASHSRPPIARMSYIARLLREGRRFTVPQVAAALEVSRKTIDRDIEFMRDQLGYQFSFVQDGIPQGERTFAGRPPKERVL